MDDREIVALFFARDESAIQETHIRFGAGLLVLAVRILNSYEDAEEVRSDTYQKAWDSIPPAAPVHLYAWLAKVCRRLSLNRLEWSSARKRRAKIIELSDELELCLPDRRASREMESTELRILLENFLKGLPGEKRKIFVSRYIYMESIEEIAKRYGLGKEKVKTDLYRTRRLLKKHLEE